MKLRFASKLRTACQDVPIIGLLRSQSDSIIPVEPVLLDIRRIRLILVAPDVTTVNKSRVNHIFHVDTLWIGRHIYDDETVHLFRNRNKNMRGLINSKPQSWAVLVLAIILTSGCRLGKYNSQQAASPPANSQINSGPKQQFAKATVKNNIACDQSVTVTNQPADRPEIEKAESALSDNPHPFYIKSKPKPVQTSPSDLTNNALDEVAVSIDPEPISHDAPPTPRIKKSLIRELTSDRKSSFDNNAFSGSQGLADDAISQSMPQEPTLLAVSSAPLTHRRRRVDEQINHAVSRESPEAPTSAIDNQVATNAQPPTNMAQPNVVLRARPVENDIPPNALPPFGQQLVIESHPNIEPTRLRSRIPFTSIEYRRPPKDNSYLQELHPNGVARLNPQNTNYILSPLPKFKSNDDSIKPEQQNSTKLEKSGSSSLNTPAIQTTIPQNVTPSPIFRSVPYRKPSLHPAKGKPSNDKVAKLNPLLEAISQTPTKPQNTLVKLKVIQQTVSRNGQPTNANRAQIRFDKAQVRVASQIDSTKYGVRDTSSLQIVAEPITKIAPSIDIERIKKEIDGRSHESDTINR